MVSIHLMDKISLTLSFSLTIFLLLSLCWLCLLWQSLCSRNEVLGNLPPVHQRVYLGHGFCWSPLATDTVFVLTCSIWYILPPSAFCQSIFYPVLTLSFLFRSSGLTFLYSCNKALELIMTPTTVKQVQLFKYNVKIHGKEISKQQRQWCKALDPINSRYWNLEVFISLTCMM